jgi:DNA-binding MarR family transcriptional regulator
MKEHPCINLHLPHILRMGLSGDVPRRLIERAVCATTEFQTYVSMSMQARKIYQNLLKYFAPHIQNEIKKRLKYPRLSLATDKIYEQGDRPAIH